MNKWIKLPTNWVLNTDNSILKKLKWSGEDKAHNTAALMVYMAIAHNVNETPTLNRPDIGIAELSFTNLTDITSLSRASVAGAINKLIEIGLIEKYNNKKINRYRLVSFGEYSGWGKLPAKKLYDKNMERINGFKNFKLRSKIELNSMKIYYLIIALRNNNNNHSQMSYSKITEYTGIVQNDINPAISLLVTNELIRVLHIESDRHEKAISNAYRLVGLDPYNHAGTKAKQDPSLLLNKEIEN